MISARKLSHIYLYTGSSWARLTTENDDTLTTSIFTPSGNVVRQTNNVRFQTFMATQTGSLLSVSVLIKDLGGVLGSRVIKLYQGNGNTGILLTTLNLAGNIPGFYWETATPPTSKINIYAGLTYTIETSEQYWVFQSGNPYAGGYSNSSFDPSDDYGFLIKVRN